MKVKTSNTGSSSSTPAKDYAIGSKLKVKLYYWDILVATVAVFLLFLGLAIGLLCFFLLEANEIRSAQEALQLLSKQRTEQLQTTISNTIRVTYTISALFSMKQDIDPYTEFLPFINNSQALAPGVFGLQYSRYIPKTSINSYENYIRSTFGRDYVNFTVNAGTDSSGRPAALPDRPKLLIITYMAPLIDNLAVMGLASRPRPVDQAEATRLPVATAPYYTTEGPLGFVIMSPTFNNGSMIGMALGVFMVESIIKSVMSNDDLSRATLLLYDNTTFSYSTDRSVTNGNEFRKNAKFSYSEPVVVADRVWNIVLTPTKLHLSSYESWQKWLGLFASLVGSWFLIMVVLVVRLQVGVKIGNINQEKVLVLEQSHKKLKKMLEKFARQEAKSRFTVNSVSDFVIVTDSKGNVVQTNDSFDKEFGFDAMNDKGLVIGYFFPDLDREFFKSGEVTQHEVSARKANDDRVTVLMTLRQLPKPDSDEAVFSEVEMDVDEGYLIVATKKQQQ